MVNDLGSTRVTWEYIINITVRICMRSHPCFNWMVERNGEVIISFSFFLFKLVSYQQRDNKEYYEKD